MVDTWYVQLEIVTAAVIKISPFKPASSLEYGATHTRVVDALYSMRTIPGIQDARHNVTAPRILQLPIYPGG